MVAAVASIAPGIHIREEAEEEPVAGMDSFVAELQAAKNLSLQLQL